MSSKKCCSAHIFVKKIIFLENYIFFNYIAILLANSIAVVKKI